MTTTKTTTTLQRYVRPEALVENVLFYDGGGSTFHNHRCPNGDGHQWLCNSPYCNTLNGLCPDHGGEEPIKIGREPWKR